MESSNIKPETIDFAQLIRSNECGGLTLQFRSKLLDQIKAEFTDDEQTWFVANFYVYLQYHPTRDFPIKLENVWSMIGFAHKKNAKRALENNFIENEDYKILLLRREKQLFERKNLGGAGLNEETILLNVDTFKNLCMITKTEKSKKIRKYYVKLEGMLNNLINEQKKEYEEKIKLLELENNSKEKELEKTKKQLENKSKLTVKKWFDQEPGHTIYGYKSKSTNLVTIGKTKNVKNRESDYITHNPDGEMFYIRRCYNCDLAEKVLHHILDKYREERNREWFNISEELTVYTIDTVCDFLDSFISCSERLPEFKIKEFISNLPIERTKWKTVEPPPSIDCSKLELTYNENIKDYNKFIQDICEVDESKSSLTLTFDLRSAYKIWCKKALSPEIYNEFKDWINENFNVKEKYIETSGMRHKVVTNLKLKELQFIVEDQYNIKPYEKFCTECCVVNYSFKMKISDFFINYIQWMQDQYPQYELSPEELTEIKNCLNQKLLVENGMIYGIQLKTDDLPYYRLKTFNKINIVNENKELVGTFNGLSEAAEHLNLEVKTVSDIIRYSRVIDYMDQKVLLVYDKGDTIIKTRNVEKDIIYMFNFDTKEIIRTFETSTDVANYLNVNQSTVLRYIAVENIFACKNQPGKKILLSYLDNIHNLVIRPKTKVVKSRRVKRLFAYNKDNGDLFQEYAGPSDAAAKLKIGQCTVHRHIKSGNPLGIMEGARKISIVFTYTQK